MLEILEKERKRYNPYANEYSLKLFDELAKLYDT
jgi:hypothetical protein